MNVNWPFKRCRRRAADLSLLAAGALAGTEHPEWIRHLDRCPECRARLAELKRLASRLDRAGRDLPAAEPPPSLRWRWQREIRSLAPAGQAPPAATPVPWFSGRRWAWGGIAAIWMLALFFRFSGPDAARPALLASPPLSLRQALLAFQTELREPSISGPADTPPEARPPLPDALPPHSRRPAMPSTRNQKIA